jgi:transposase
VQISTGSVAAIVAETAANLAPFIERARQLLIAAGVVCVDETGARIAGRLGWVHVSSDPTLTLLTADERRGKIGTDANGWTAYRGYDCEHALCHAHHLRELQAAAETGEAWAAHLAETLRYANKAVKAAKANGQTALTPAILTAIKARYAGHIAQGHTANPSSKGARSDAANLLKRLDERRAHALRFTIDFVVPFDNNQAERDLRPVKVRQKISGSWRTMAGAKRFCTTRSCISTLRKQGHRLLDGLARATLGDPWLPAAPATA